MRVLICSHQAQVLLPLLAPLQLAVERCDLAALVAMPTADIGAILIEEEVWAAGGEHACAAPLRASVPVILLGAAGSSAPLASLAAPGVLVLERPFSSRSLCSCLAAVLARPGSDGVRNDADLALLQSQKMDAVASLTGGIAHDFNNMLTGVIGALDIMKRRIAKGQVEGLERFIEAASVSADRASALTQRLLTFSHRQPLHARPVDVDQLLSSLELLVRRTVSDGITLRSHYQPCTARVMVDARQLESAILNLAINARDAMPGGGQIELQTSLVDLAAEDMSALPDLSPGGYLLIEFSDTGAGMGSDTLEKVFDPFFTTKSLGQGSGLGLSMVHGFARQSGGQVTIHSEPGVGTTVRLYLPVADCNAAAPAPAAESGPTRVATHRVLLVEGDSAARLLACEVLVEMGCEAVNAAEPQAAIDLLISSTPFDLLISDVSLPGMTGVQLAAVAYRHRPELPVLLIAGKGESAPPVAGQAVRSIAKPFSMRELHETLVEMLPVRH